MYGTPVIGADIGGIPELIDNGKTGVLFESGNVDSLVKTIKELWNNDNKLKEMSTNCKNVEFDTIEQYYDKVLSIYRG